MSRRDDNRPPESKEDVKRAKEEIERDIKQNEEERRKLAVIHRLLERELQNIVLLRRPQK